MRGRSDWRRAWLIVACLVVCAIADAYTAPARVPIAGAFLGFIWAAIVAVGQWLASTAVTTAITIAQAAWMIGRAIVDFGRLVGGVFVRVYGFLGDFWEGALRPFVSWSWRWIQRLHDWLARTFRPLVDFLERVRHYVDLIYRRWLTPIVTAIAVVRLTFQVLARLHVPFAREIDRKLAELEARLVAPFQIIYRTLNEAMDWINRIVTLDGLFQKLTLLASMAKHAHDAWAVLLHRQLAGVDPEANDAMHARAYPSTTPAAIAAPLTQHTQSGTGPYADEIAALARLARDALTNGAGEQP